MQTISIIIPTCNEESIIAETIEQLLRLTENTPEVEIIVSDSSTDTTPCILSRFPVIIGNSAKGRSQQMNNGARLAKGAILYFLHADTVPPATFIEDIRLSVATGKQAGCFRMRFDDNHPLMSFFGWCTQFPLMICRGGDQSLFITKELFQAIGGFNEQLLLMEDYDIIARIEQCSQFHILDKDVTTSARKYHANGIIQLQAMFGALHLMNALGFPQEEMIRFYRENIV